MDMLLLRRYYLLIISCILLCITAGGMAMSAQDEKIISLPMPRLTGEQSLEALLQQRRSVREYQDAGLSLAEVSQLLWAAQGITHAEELRTAPSAGALYPLELFVVVGDLEGMNVGVYHYQPEGHRLRLIKQQDHRRALARAALSQPWVSEAAAVLVFAGVVERTTKKYGQRGIRYVHIEVGHAAQNAFLQTEALGLATVVVGAFDDDAVAEVLGLPSEAQPLLLMPIGRR
jgi:SagB-type dehydrogenase family enzyme